MTDADGSTAVGRAAHRREWARVLGATVRSRPATSTWREECAQDAFAQALQTWPRTGVPDRPGAWLTTVARNRALDVLRRETVLRRTLPLLVTTRPADAPGPTTPVRRRPAPAGLHLLPSGAVAGRAGRADAAAGVRAVDRRGGPRLPGAGVDHGGAGHPGQEEDRRGPHPVPGAVAGPSCGERVGAVLDGRCT